jgi:hypothetical protein
MRFRLPKPIRDWIRSREVEENWVEVSECCFADRWIDTDVCESCKEHTVFMEVKL